MIGPYEWNRCYYMDCLEGLKQLPDKSIDLCLTDPPYNIKCHLSGVEREGSKKIAYTDKKTDEEYWSFMGEFWHEVKRICHVIVFTPGYTNFREWLRMDDFWYLFWYNPGRQGCCKVAWINKMELILVHGIDKRPQAERFKLSTIATVNDLSIPFIHPCPRNIKVWHWIIRNVKPSSILDPFLGSGTTAQAAESLGIPWLGFELMEAYKPDIDKRIALGKKEFAKPKQRSLF